MTIPKQLTFQGLVSALKTAQDTLIIFHRSPDADAIGSAFALRFFLEQRGCRAYCISPDNVSPRLSFLMQGVQEATTRESIPKDFKIKRIITVDVASPSQMGNLFDIYGENVDIMIDHHSMGTPFGKNCFVAGDAAATGEILFDVFTAMEENDNTPVLNTQIASSLYASISGDTGGFRFSNTISKTHMRAAKLLEYNIDAANINHLLFESDSLTLLQAKALGIEKVQLFRDGKLAIVGIDWEEREQHHLSDDDLQILVEVARSVQGVQVGVSVRQPEKNGIYRVSMRSSSSFDVASYCAKYNGGGHKKAAGCSMEANNITEVIEKIAREIEV